MKGLLSPLSPRPLSPEYGGEGQAMLNAMRPGTSLSPEYGGEGHTKHEALVAQQSNKHALRSGTNLPACPAS